MDVWKFPRERLYVTVYKPGEGDPADFDQEACVITSYSIHYTKLYDVDRGGSDHLPPVLDTYEVVAQILVDLAQRPGEHVSLA